jgi:dTDP-4-dehydrorhamnose reductase
VILRTSSVFGLAGAGADSGGNFVGTMLRLGRERVQLRVLADNAMAPTFSADLARAALDLVRLRLEPGIYHMTNQGRASGYGVTVAAVEMAGGEAELEPITAAEYPTPARRPGFSVLDTRDTTELAGRMPTWQDALRRYLVLRDAVEVPSTTECP